MTRREFDELTKRNHGTWMTGRSRREYKVARLVWSDEFPPERDRLADRAIEKRMNEEHWGVVGNLFDRRPHARSKFRALKAHGHSDGGVYA